jgi:hypothetical protein
MTVKQLIEILREMPEDYYVYYEAGEYKEHWEEIEQVEVCHISTLGTYRGVYLR